MNRGSYGRGGYGHSGRGRGRGRGGGRGGNNNKRTYSEIEQERMSGTQRILESILQRIDGSSYGAYKQLMQYSYELDNGMILYIDHVQSDPYAPPSDMRIRAPMPTIAKFPPDSYCVHNSNHDEKQQSSLECDIRNIALCDYITRVFHRVCRASTSIKMSKPTQHVIHRSSIIINDEYIEARCSVSMPARGRTILGRACMRILCEELVRIASQSLKLSSLSATEMWSHIHSIEDQEHLRNTLASHDLIGFICNGAILPRQSGNTDVPMSSTDAVAFQSPPSLQVTLCTPNGGDITGMGIRKGITLIAGGGFHGKTTVLQALEMGCYNHIPGDGREMVVCDVNAVKIRAEDGRCISAVNISPFITNLPLGQDTRSFQSLDASGSTSQAANIIEALEAGASTLIIDEDTSATNFMIRDQRMQELVAKDKEPIIPFVHRVKALSRDYDCSTVLVIGGCGDYFDVADCVITMDSYQPKHVTNEAKAIASRYPSAPSPDTDTEFGALSARRIDARSLRCTDATGKVRTKSLRTYTLGYSEIDLSCVEQLVEPQQTRVLTQLCKYIQRRYGDDIPVLSVILDDIDDIFNTRGLDAITSDGRGPNGAYSRPRRFEIAAALNRTRFLRYTQVS